MSDIKYENQYIVLCLEKFKEEFLSKYPESNCDFYVYSQAEVVGLDLIYVSPSLRRRGVGSEFMRTFVDIVDQFSWRAMLTASDEHGVPIKSLVDFYSRYGFEVEGQQEYNSRGESLQKMLRVKTQKRGCYE